MQKGQAFQFKELQLEKECLCYRPGAYSGGGAKGARAPPLEFRGQMPPPTILWANAPPPYF